MVSRKSKAASTSQSFDALKFVSFATQERYTSHLKLKSIQERGLVQILEYEVKKVILDNKQELFCEHPDLIVVPKVRKFYANGIKQDGLIVIVQGKPIPFDRTTINQYYGLTDIDNGEYYLLIENDGTNQEAIKDYPCKDNVA